MSTTIGELIKHLERYDPTIVPQVEVVDADGLLRRVPLDYVDQDYDNHGNFLVILKGGEVAQ